MERLSTRDRYKGYDQVQVANGTGLSIAHVGSSSVAMFNHPPILLKNVLHVPNIKKNLLSVHKLASDNNAFLEFYPHCFFY